MKLSKEKYKFNEFKSGNVGEEQSWPLKVLGVKVGKQAARGTAKGTISNTKVLQFSTQLLGFISA